MKASLPYLKETPSQTAGPYVAYMLAPNWLSVFLMGRFVAQRWPIANGGGCGGEADADRRTRVAFGHQAQLGADDEIADAFAANLKTAV